MACTCIHTRMAIFGTLIRIESAVYCYTVAKLTILTVSLEQKAWALIPLELYFNEQNRVKLLIGLCRGKKLYDKRADMARRDVDREIRRAIKEKNRY